MTKAQIQALKADLRKVLADPNAPEHAIRAARKAVDEAEKAAKK
jgi:hypothetical protein